MIVFGWIVWGIACFVFLSFVFAAFSSRDLGLRAHHMRHSLLIAAGLIITFVTQISKLHLLWWIPLTFFLNQSLSILLIGTNKRQSGILINDREWGVIDGEPCRVTDFSPLGSMIDTSGKTQSVDKTTPYACITMECKKFGKDTRGYISHKMDFEHLWAAFKDRTMKEDEEVIIYWTKKHYTRPSNLFSAFLPRLWVMVCPKGTFELIIDLEYKPELTGEARWNAMNPIIDWKPEVMR